MRNLVGALLDPCVLEFEDIVTIAEGLSRYGATCVDDLDSAPVEMLQGVPPELQVWARELVEHITKAGNERVSLAVTRMKSDGEQVMHFIENGVEAIDKAPTSGGRKQAIADMLVYARMVTVFNSIQATTRASYRSGIRSWLRFCNEVIDKTDNQMDVDVNELLLWGCRFESVGTLKNYLSAVTWGCDLLGKDTSAFRSSLIKRMKSAVGLRTVQRARPALQRAALVKMVAAADEDDDPCAAALYTLAYAFLSRVQSELMPAVLCEEVRTLDDAAETKSTLSVKGDKVTLRLAWRKNSREPIVLVRECWCDKLKAACPVCRTRELLRLYGHGVAPFTILSCTAHRRIMKRHLAASDLLETMTFHSFRRGHARDLAASGVPLAVILRAGGWNSAAFVAYLDMALVGDMAIQKCIEAVESIVSDSDKDPVVGHIL